MFRNLQRSVFLAACMALLASACGADDLPLSWQILTRPDFSMEIPPGVEVTANGDTVRIDLPRTPGTMLDERSAVVTITVCSSAESCFGDLPADQTITVSNLTFRVLPGWKWEADMGGKRFYMTEYGAFLKGKCVRIMFRMLLRDLTGFSDAPPRPLPPEEETDTKVFERMLSSFRLAD